MSQQTNLNVPASLIEQTGTYADAPAAAEVIGKKVRLTDGPSREEAVQLDGAPFIIRAITVGHMGYNGAEGTVIHVSADGELWVDFGDDKGVAKNPEGSRIIGVGELTEPAEERTYEFIAG